MNKRSICTVAVALALGLSSAVRPGADASADELAGPAEIAARVSTGEWFEIPDTQMRQVLVKPDAVPEGAHGTRGPAAVLDDSGAAFDGRRLYVHGGGTKTYGGNEVYAFDLASLTWERLTEPTALRDPAAGKSCAGLVDEDLPPASATNDGVVWSRLTQSLFVWHSPVYCHDGWGGGRAGVWEFEPQERTWTYAAPHPGRWGAVTSVDPATGAVIVATKNHAWEFDVTAKQYTRRSPRTRLVTNGVAAIDAGRRLLVVIDDASGVRTVKLDGENLGSFESVLDELPHEDMYRWALVYHGGRKQFVLWTGSPEVYTLDPETWELALFDRAASGPKPPRRDAAVYSKWVYLVAHDVFVGVNSVDSGVWVYRMPDEPLAAGSNRVATAPPSVGAIKGKSGEGAVLRVCPPDEPGAGCGYTSLQRAVDDAEPGSVIVLAPGVYRQAAVVRRDRLTIRGEAGAHLMGTAAQGKGALVLKGNDTVVEGIECRLRARQHLRRQPLGHVDLSQQHGAANEGRGARHQEPSPAHGHRKQRHRGTGRARQPSDRHSGWRRSPDPQQRPRKGPVQRQRGVDRSVDGTRKGFA